MISIIVPVYNVEKYLCKCIDSIINQSFCDIEVILVDDGSTDNSGKICDKYKEKDGRVKVIHKNNEGVAIARNIGLDIAKGEYIAFVDSDDYVSKDMYTKMYEVAIKENADIVECSFYRVEESQDNKLIPIQLKKEIINGEYECSKHYVSRKNTTNYLWNKIYKKDLIDEIRFPISVCSEDYVFNVECYYRCQKNIILSDIMYYYRINKNSACHKKFYVGRLDAITNGKIVYNFYKYRFKDLCSFAANYIVNYSMEFYISVEKSNIRNKKQILKEIEYEFNEYYPLILGMAYNNMTFKRKFLLKVFKTNKLLYKFINRIKG